MVTIAEIRQKYPQYDDLSDQELADRLYARRYADMPRAKFDAAFGVPGKQAPTATTETPTADGLGRLFQALTPSRSLVIGTQGAGRGMADVVGSPADLTTDLLNALLWGADKIGRGAHTAAKALLPQPVENYIPNMGVEYRFPPSPIGSDSVADAFSKFAKYVGAPIVDEGDMTPFERAGYNVNRFTVDALAAASGFTRGVSQRLPGAPARSPVPPTLDPVQFSTPDATTATAKATERPSPWMAKPAPSSVQTTAPWSVRAAKPINTTAANAPTNTAVKELEMAFRPAPVDPAVEATKRYHAADQSQDFVIGGQTDPRFLAKAEADLFSAEWQFLNAVPTTDLGRTLKVKEVQRWLRTLTYGDTLTEKGKNLLLQHLHTLRESIGPRQPAATGERSSLENLRAAFEPEPYDEAVDALKRYRDKSDALKFVPDRQAQPEFIQDAMLDRDAAKRRFLSALPTTERGKAAKIDEAMRIIGRGPKMTETQVSETVELLDSLLESFKNRVP